MEIGMHILKIMKHFIGVMILFYYSDIEFISFGLKIPFFYFLFKPERSALLL